MNEPEAWSEAAIAMAGIALVTVITAIVIWQVFGTWRAKMLVSREKEYQKLAEEAVAAQQQMASAQTKLAEEMTELRGRVDSMERMLREVG